MTKQEIIANESAFQRACSFWVERNIGECVSSLMYPIGQNLDRCAEIFDFDYDEALGWFQKDDYSEVVDNFIDDADLDDLETIADMVGDWGDVVDEVIGVSEEEFEEETGVEYGQHLEANIRQLRTKVRALITNDSEYVEIGQHLNLDSDYSEIYEYWVLPEGWTAQDLIDEGQVVFEFAGLRIWGRQTTGQSISIDGVIRRIVKALDEDHWIWGKV